MIIDYDHNPNISDEQRTQSLKESVQMALQENDADHLSFKSMLDKVSAWIKSPFLHNSTTNTDTYYIAKRDDTGTMVGFGVGSGGTNHGIWSYALNKWMIFSNGVANKLYDTKSGEYASFRTPPSHITLFNAHAYKATTTGWEYVGKSFTVPNNHVYLVRLVAGYTSGKPIGIGINSVSTLGSVGFPDCGYLENANGMYYTPAFLLSAGTYYVFAKRASVPTTTNNHSATAIDIPI